MDVYVAQTNAVAGDAIYADAISIVPTMPAPTPTPTPTPSTTFSIVQSNQQFFTMATTFTPTLSAGSRAGSSIVLLVSAAGDGNSSFSLPPGWLPVADVTDGNPAGLHLFYYPSAPSGTGFGAFTQSPAANLAYTIVEVGAGLSL